MTPAVRRALGFLALAAATLVASQAPAARRPGPPPIAPPYQGPYDTLPGGAYHQSCRNIAAPAAAKARG